MIKISKLIIVLCVLCFFPAVAFSSQIYFYAPKNILSTGEEFLVNIVLDPQNESINATAGTVKFPADLLELKEVRDGNSSVNFWVEKPQVGNSDSVSFSGITAGGFPNYADLIFSLVFRAKQSGKGSLKFENAEALKNDGTGAKSELQNKELNLNISDQSATSSADISIKDTEPPAKFIPIIGNNSAIYGGKYFLVFFAQDKASGIDHYEVKEGYFGKFAAAESPYLLNDQALDKKIYVKAVDKNGNYVVETLPAQRLPWWFKYCLVVAIIILICVFIIYRRRRSSWRWS